MTTIGGAWGGWPPPPVGACWRAVRARARVRRAPPPPPSEPDEEDADEEEVEEPYGAGGSSSDAALDGASDSANVEEAAAAAPGSARGSGEWGGRGHVRLVWKGEIDQADAVGRRHFRFMESCECSGIMELVPGGEPCVRLSVRGASFMLHQIRWVPYLLLLPALVSPI